MKKIVSFIRKTPYYKTIFSLQVLSSFLAFAGIPLLIPVIELAEGGGLLQSKTSEDLIGMLAYIGIDLTFYSLIVFVTIVIISSEIIKFSASILAEHSRTILTTTIREKIVGGYLRQNWLKINDLKKGLFNDSIIRQADAYAYVHLNALRVVINLIQFAAFTLVAFYISIQTTFIALIVYMSIALINRLNHKGHTRVSVKYNNNLEDLSHSINGLQINNKFYKATAFYDASKLPIKLMYLVRKNYLKIVFREQLQGLWTVAIGLLFLVTILYNYQYLNIAFSELLVIVLVFQKLSPAYQAVQKSLLDMRRELPTHDAAKSVLDDISNSIEPIGKAKALSPVDVYFENVYFSYNTSGKNLESLTMSFPSKTTTAIIGKSGSGKTTLVDLYLGLLRPDQGNIYYSGVSHKNLDYHDLRSKIAYVGQNVTLIDGTIYDNLIINQNALNFTEVDIRNSLEMVGLNEFSNEESLYSYIGENGSKLSGGERQRLLIARAILTKSEILILDEPTSSLDSESRKSMYSLLESLNGKITIILITHSVAEAKGVDFVFKVDKLNVKTEINNESINNAN